MALHLLFSTFSAELGKVAYSSVFCLLKVITVEIKGALYTDDITVLFDDIGVT